MLHHVSIIFGTIALAGMAFPQNLSDSALPIDGAIQHGGTLHLATGTWTRNLPNTVNLGPDIIYNNSAYTGFFTSMNSAAEPESFEIVDSGRVPSISSGVSTVDRNFYSLNCIDVGYCVGDDTGLGALTLSVALYNNYSPCTAPNLNGCAPTFNTGALPGTTAANAGTANVSCWVVQLDLTGMEICLAGDGDGLYQGDLNFDSFGIGYEFDPGGMGGYVGNVDVGPIIAGDRNWTTQAPGEYAGPGGPAGGGGGGGTYYGPAENCLDPMNPLVLNSTGYDSLDFFYVGYGPSSLTSPGCFFLGTYSNLLSCNAGGSANITNPPSAVYSVLYADSTASCSVAGCPITTFCDPNNANSTGSAAQLTSSVILPASSSRTELHLDVSGGPPGEFGYFLVGEGVNTTTPIALGNGLLCLNAPGSTIARYNVSGVGSLINSVGQFDANGDLVNIVGTSSTLGGLGFDVPVDLPNPLTGIVAGQTWHFQCWYRDTPAGPGQSNLTNGLSHTF